jgi:hypothetical protein
MVCYDYLNLELVSLKTKMIDLFKETFWCYSLFCVFFSLGNMKTFFVLGIFFLKLCGIWVHLNLGMVDKLNHFCVNVPIVGKFKSWKLNGNRKTR